MSFSESYAAAQSRIVDCYGQALLVHVCAVQAMALPGEFWECGVYKGGTARLIADVIRTGAPRPFHLFDTFAGFPAVTSEDGGRPQPGWFGGSNADDVRDFVNADFATLHVGNVPDTFAGLENSRIAFAYLDVDLYKPTFDALTFVLPRMVPGGIILVGDYGDKHWPGAKLAVDQLIEQKRIMHFEYKEFSHQAVIRPAE